MARIGLGGIRCLTDRIARILIVSRVGRGVRMFGTMVL